MKSFFDFYEKIRNRKMNEQDAMTTPNMGMGMGAPAGMPPMSMDGGMGSMGGVMGGMGGMGGGMGGMGGVMAMPDMSMGDMGSEDEGGSMDAGKDRSNVAPPAHEMKDDQALDMLKAVYKFAKKAVVNEDDEPEKHQAQESAVSQIAAALENLAKMTGQEAPDLESDDEDENPESTGDEKSSGQGMIPPDTETPYGKTFGNPAGGDGNDFSSNGGGSGDMGGNMAGGSTPGTTGPGALGFGGGFAG